MAHPPETSSDLSMSEFLELSVKDNKLVKHLKLDWKELEAVEPTLEKLQSLQIQGSEYVVYLNADILVGPAKTQDDIAVPPKPFLETCLK